MSSYNFSLIFLILNSIEKDKYIPHKEYWEYDFTLNDKCIETVRAWLYIRHLQRLLSKYVLNEKGKVKFKFKLIFFIKYRRFIVGPNYYGIDSGHYSLPTSKGMVDFEIT